MLPSFRVYLAVLGIAFLVCPVFATDPTPQRKAWDILEAGVKEKNSTKRHAAVHALGLLAGDPKAVTFAEMALEDHIPEVREAAAMSLGLLLSNSSIPKLEHALNDKEVSVVLAAAHSLWILRDKDAYDVYYEILLGERKGGQGFIAGQEETLKDPKKLAKFGFEQGVEFNPFSSMGWNILTMVRKDDVSPVKAAAAKVLASDPDPRSGAALARASSDKHWIVRAAAVEAIAQRGDPDSLKDLEPRLSDEKDTVRFVAAAAVIRLSTAPPHAQPPATMPGDK